MDPESVSVVRELEPLIELAASRSTREDAEVAALFAQAAADQAVLDQQRAAAEAVAQRAAEEAAAQRAAEEAAAAQAAAARRAAVPAPATKAPAAELGVEYVIWKQRMLSSPVGSWNQMENRGSATANHLDHVHVNYR